MAIEKLYLTDTFRVWAEKFNATIDASNTATANAEEAVKKAEEAVKKAEEAVNDSVKGDDITTIVNEERQVVVKDVAIGGDTSDLASSRGQIGHAVTSKRTTILDIDKSCYLTFTGSDWGNVTDKPFEAGFGALVIAQLNSGTAARRGAIIAISHSNGEMWIANIKETEEPKFIKIINYNDIISSIGMQVSSNGKIIVDDIAVKGNITDLASSRGQIGDIIDSTKLLNNDFNNLTNSGIYFVKSTKGTTKNSPIDLTAFWWVKVTAAVTEDDKNILQEVRLHSTDSGGVAYSLARCKGTTWGPWEYAYTQFAG